MYRQYNYRQWLWASLFAVWSFMASGTVASHELAKHVADAHHKEQVATVLSHSSHLYGKGVRIMVYEGRATLSGKLRNAVLRDLAKQLALAVHGITSVDNRLVVESEYVPALTPSGRSYPQVVARAEARALSDTRRKEASVISSREQGGWGATDLWISTKVRLAFMFSDSIDADNLSVNTRNGVVIIRGWIADGAGYSLAVARAGNIQGVKGVDASRFSHTSPATDEPDGRPDEVVLN